MRCELQGVVHTASRVVERDDELGTEGRAPLDVGVLVDVAGDAEVDQVQLAGLGIVDSTVQVHRAGYNSTVQVYRIGYNSAVQVIKEQYRCTEPVITVHYSTGVQNWLYLTWVEWESGSPQVRVIFTSRFGG